MKSGMLAAEAVAECMADESNPAEPAQYEQMFRDSWLWGELQGVRNIRPAFKWGLLPGLAAAALETLTGGRAPWTLAHGAASDRAAPAALPGAGALATRPGFRASAAGGGGDGAASSSTPPRPLARPAYPPPDGQLTFPLADALYRSGTNHAHDQPSHLLLRNPRVSASVSAALHGGPEARFCPAGVFEWVDARAPGGAAGAPPLREAGAIAAAAAAGAAHLRIAAQNCLHCKACDIKDPSGNIVWTPPEGGGGPAYVDT
jgi:electron-transferring-flavoprotein dehydrogenase